MSKGTFKSNIPQVIQIIENAAKDGALSSMYKVLEASQAIVPLDMTPLQKSGALTEDGNTIYVSYGQGESADYAIIQHENLEYRHAPGRQAKYLEQPFRTAQPNILQTIANRINEKL
jgi:hypothetical protein